MDVFLAIAMGAQLSVAAVPERVCIDPRTGYPNVDLVVTNPTGTVHKISEIRGMVFDAGATLLERRLIWQDSLRATRPDSEVPAMGEAVLFNALPFNTAAPGRRLRFEIDLNPGSRVLIGRGHAGRLRGGAGAADPAADRAHPGL
jgi:hypothetical protein